MSSGPNWPQHIYQPLALDARIAGRTPLFRADPVASRIQRFQHFFECVRDRTFMQGSSEANYLWKELPMMREASREKEVAMNITTLIAAAAVGAGLAFVAPSAEAMPRGLAPATAADTGHVQKVHGTHCRVIRGHRSRCVKRRIIRNTHRHKHCHSNGCHSHRHASNHHR